MDMFHEIPEAQAILVSSGTYRQVALYRRGEGVYAKSGAGFIRLFPMGGTSTPATRWVEFEAGPSGTISDAGCYLTFTPKSTRKLKTVPAE